jgi:hypothetical protein
MGEPKSLPLMVPEVLISAVVEVSSRSVVVRRVDPSWLQARVLSL